MDSSGDQLAGGEDEAAGTSASEGLEEGEVEGRPSSSWSRRSGLGGSVPRPERGLSDQRPGRGGRRGLGLRGHVLLLRPLPQVGPCR
ncbi:hypothetical protein FQN60_007109, partial [Etheostoma spectabile]